MKIFVYIRRLITLKAFIPILERRIAKEIVLNSILPKKSF
jgi:hypothetical protein